MKRQEFLEAGREMQNRRLPTTVAIEQLEASGYVSLPRFLKKDGKIYRASNTLNNYMEYLQEISSFKLLEHTGNTFTYEAVVTPLYHWLDETEKKIPKQLLLQSAFKTES